MILFLRRLRQKLLQERKFSKYLLYAAGEIFLVVIGILIALQLNIKRGETEEKVATQELLLGIQKDLALELERIEFLQGYYTVITDGIQQLINAHNDVESISNEELGMAFMRAFEFRKFSKYNVNYQTLYSSGLLKTIKDRDLTEKLIRYYTKQFLEWSLEIYQQKATNFNFNEAELFDPLDKLGIRSNYEHIPNFKLEIKTKFSTNFAEFIREKDVLHFLLDLLHQSGLVYYNLKNYKETNLVLTKKIHMYINQ